MKLNELSISKARNISPVLYLVFPEMVRWSNYRSFNLEMNS